MLKPAEILGEVGHLGQNQRRHGQIGKGQGRQEPSGLVPDLCFLWEPCLQHAEVQESAEGLTQQIDERNKNIAVAKHHTTSHNIAQHHNPLARRQVARVMNVCVVFGLKLLGVICAGSTLCGSICIRTYACACMM